MNKQNTYDDDIDLPMNNLKRLMDQKNKSTQKNSEPDWRFFRFVFKQDLSDQYDQLLRRYLKEKESYSGNFSHNVFFPTCVEFLVDHFKKKKIYKEAPPQFIAMITRRGRRRKTARSATKENKDTLFIRVEPEVYDKYINIIYSYAKYKGDEFNRDYSTAYFFEDFKNLIVDNFQDLLNAESRT